MRDHITLEGMQAAYHKVNFPRGVFDNLEWEASLTLANKKCTTVWQRRGQRAVGCWPETTQSSWMATYSQGRIWVEGHQGGRPGLPTPKR
jgi:hypothetical protein